MSLAFIWNTVYLGLLFEKYGSDVPDLAIHLVGLIGLCLFLYWIWTAEPIKKYRHLIYSYPKMSLLFMITVCAIIGSGIGTLLWWSVYRHQPPAPTTQPQQAKQPESASTPSQQDRPYISPKLVIEAIVEGKVKFHLQILNIGKLPANNIRASLVNDKFLDVEREPPVIRTLPPGGQMAIPYYGSIIRTEDINRFMVKIFYNSDVNGSKKEFLSKYDFLVRVGESAPQTLDPIGWVEREGGFEEERQEEDARAVSQFAKTQGTVFLVLEQFNEDGTPNVVGYANNSRTFLFDPMSRLVTFKFQKIDGQWASLEFPLFNINDGKHVIAISWDYPRSALLEVDGNQRKYVEAEKE